MELGGIEVKGRELVVDLPALCFPALLYWSNDHKHKCNISKYAKYKITPVGKELIYGTTLCG